MNGTGTRKGYGFDAGRLSPARAAGGAAGGRTLVEGYRKDILGNFEKEKPRYNPVSEELGGWRLRLVGATTLTELT